MMHSKRSPSAFAPPLPVLTIHAKSANKTPAKHARRPRQSPQTAPVATSAQHDLPKPSSPRLETMVHASQHGIGAAEELDNFLRTAPREVHAGGACSGRRRTESVVNSYVLPPEAEVVVIQRGF